MFPEIANQYGKRPPPAIPLGKRDESIPRPRSGLFWETPVEKSCAVSSTHLPEVINRDAAVCQGGAPMHEAEKEEHEPICESSFVSPQKFPEDTLKLTDWCRVSR